MSSHYINKPTQFEFANVTPVQYGESLRPPMGGQYSRVGGMPSNFDPSLATAVNSRFINMNRPDPSQQMVTYSAHSAANMVPPQYPHYRSLGNAEDVPAPGLQKTNWTNLKKPQLHDQQHQQEQSSNKRTKNSFFDK